MAVERRFGLAFDWLFAQWLWVAEPCRRQGIGSRLLASAGAAARENRCRAAFLVRDFPRPSRPPKSERYYRSRPTHASRATAMVICAKWGQPWKSAAKLRANGPFSMARQNCSGEGLYEFDF